MYTWDDGTYLAHHGIKGQKWGVRRFQNPDGTYTSEGKERRGQGFRKGNRKSQTLSEARKKDINHLTTKELREYNDRLQAEQQFKQLTKKRSATGQIIKTGATAAATAAVTKIFAKAMTAEAVKNAAFIGLGILVSMGIVK